MAEEVSVAKASFVDSTREYIGDIRAEMKRVTWPSKERVQSTTLVVILSVFIFALYFRVADWVIENTITRAYTALVK